MMQKKSHFKKAMPYKEDELNLPVYDLEAAIPYYETILGFRLISIDDTPMRKAMLERDAVKIGLAENGGDPTQEGCFFEVDDVETAFAELQARGLNKKEAGFRIDKHGEASWKVFFLIAPDGLCYCLGQKLE
jgi:catechol 2,3-dioxygenase-like lactoylglutathione lyase family enzyme